MININNSLKFLTISLSLASVSGCSVLGKAGDAAKNVTSFGGQQSSSNTVAVNEKLIIPPSLKKPTPQASKRISSSKTSNTAKQQKAKNYYVVVGTYPDQGQALDTFVRLSSIGLPGATMESRTTTKGKVLHMVRLGPYQKQEDIDRVKDSLTSDGLSQFKVVAN